MFARCTECRRLLLVGESPWERMSVPARAFLQRMGAHLPAWRVFTCSTCAKGMR